MEQHDALNTEMRLNRVKREIALRMKGGGGEAAVGCGPVPMSEPVRPTAGGEATARWPLRSPSPPPQQAGDAAAQQKQLVLPDGGVPAVVRDDSVRSSAAEGRQREADGSESADTVGGLAEVGYQQYTTSPHAAYPANVKFGIFYSDHMTNTPSDDVHASRQRTPQYTLTRQLSTGPQQHNQLQATASDVAGTPQVTPGPGPDAAEVDKKRPQQKQDTSVLGYWRLFQQQKAGQRQEGSTDSPSHQQQQQQYLTTASSRGLQVRGSGSQLDEVMRTLSGADPVMTNANPLFSPRINEGDETLLSDSTLQHHSSPTR